MATKEAGFVVGSINSVKSCNEGVEIQLTHPNGDKIPAFITIAGIDSDIYQAARRKVTNATLKRISKGKAGKKTAEDIDAEDMAMLVSCTLSWRGFVGEDGKEYHCTPSNIKTLYSENPWIAEQVDEAIADRALFIKD